MENETEGKRITPLLLMHAYHTPPIALLSGVACWVNDADELALVCISVYQIMERPGELERCEATIEIRKDGTVATFFNGKVSHWLD